MTKANLLRARLCTSTSSKKTVPENFFLPTYAPWKVAHFRRAVGEKRTLTLDNEALKCSAPITGTDLIGAPAHPLTTYSESGHRRAFPALLWDGRQQNSAWDAQTSPRSQ